MCWIGTSSAKIAEKDIVVYKIGKVLNNKFRSLYQNYIYGVKELNAKISLRPASDWDYIPHSLIWEGYHSYKDVTVPFNKLEESFRGIYVGKIKMIMPLINDYYLGTFIIPKGTTYCLNNKGEVVSDGLIYTGNHIVIESGKHYNSKELWKEK